MNLSSTVIVPATVSAPIDLRKAPNNSDKRHSSQQAVTVVVPVRNEESHIARTLDQLLQQQRDNLTVEILVVDGCSTDRTRQIVERYARQNEEIRLLANPNRLSSSARNIAIRESSGQYIVIVDGHCELPTRTYFLDLINAFERTDADCLGRPQPLDIGQATVLQRAIAAARSSWLGHHPASFVYVEREVDCPAASVAVAYRRDVFDRVGLFDERFDACEDYELNHRIDLASLKCRCVPELAVKYHPRDTLRGLFVQLLRYGRGRVRLMRKHPGSFRILAALRILVFVLLAAPLVSWAWPAARGAYFAAVGAYIFTVAAVSLGETVRKRDSQLLLWMPAAFVTVHLGAVIGILLETLVGRKKTLIACAE